MTTPNEFLQFAKQMGLGRTKSPSSSSSSPSRLISNTNNYTTTATTMTTGLCVLNNLCCLIEQIHQLKAENDHLRAHIELNDHISKFQQRISLKENSTDQKEKREDRSKTLSPSNSFKIKQSKSNREQKGINYDNQQDNSSSIFLNDHDQPDQNDQNLGLTTWNNWNKVRHAFKFSLRRKNDYTTSPPLLHVDRQIPTINVSIESDDDHLQDNKRLKKKKKKTVITTDNQQRTIGDDSDQDDESRQFVRAYHKRRLYEDHTATSSSTERQEASVINLRSTNNTTSMDDENLLTRKQSKIARYRRKLRSKLDTVKRQFSDQSSSTSIRLFHQSHGSTLDDIGSGLNHAILTAQLAPALTKSYQQKMREWQTMQKSHFLVNYRRQSVTTKSDSNNISRKPSMVVIINETTTKPRDSTLITDNYPSIIEESNLEHEIDLPTLGPILSPNQRSLIVHQWREIMSEEISLRHCHEYLQQKINVLKELETNLKTLKTNIFCTKNSMKQQSMINIREYDQSYLPRRCRSLQTLISMPASWILAVQSAAYSDVLDGTLNKPSEQAILFNKKFFDQLEQFKRNRQKFEQDSIKDLQLLQQLKTTQRTISSENQTHVRFVPIRSCLRKLSLIDTFEYPQHYLPDPMIPLQTTISQIQPSSSSSNTGHYSTTIITNEMDSNNKTSSMNNTKRSKRSRFDLKETFSRSKSMCAAQITSWLQRRRQQQHPSVPRRKSATETKITIPNLTPKLFGSPRLARLHQRIFRHPTLPTSSTNHTPTSEQILDDSDKRSQCDLPVRIYFPPLTAPTPRRVRIIDVNSIISSNDEQDFEPETLSDLTKRSKNRQYSSSSSSSFKMTTAKERRESFATLSNVFNNRYS
ncbi:unnamed protein product [Adineta steineri]|uniref:Uncharacterized protein n=1 Tax=Adineta steineri TaxID=433720 RepID=A0A813YNK0_9BILA|nr:unnamed protein product [Adineta steineri]CAF1373204.1 unnamed protein product [Adineta steineri]